MDEFESPLFAVTQNQVDAPHPALEPLRQLGTACAWLVSAWLAQQFGDTALLIWPPAGIALAALLRWGPRMALGVALGVCALALLSSTPLPLLGVQILAEVGAPLLVLIPMRRLAFQVPMRDGWSLGLFLSLGVLLAPLLRGLGLLLAPLVQGQACETWPSLFHHWAAGALGVQMLGGLLLSVRTTSPRVPRPVLLPQALLLLAIALSAAAALLGPSNLAPASFLPLVLLGGLALLEPPGLAPFGALLLLAAGIAASTRGHGPLQAVAPQTRLAWLWAYGISAGMLSLVMQTCRVDRRAVRRSDHHLLDLAGIGQAHWRLSEGRAEYSPTWERMLGPHHDEGNDPTHWLEQAHPLDRERLIDALCTLLAPGGSTGWCQALRLSANCDGKQWRWHELRAEVEARDGNGRATHLVTLLSDIDATHIAEERQRTSASLFRNLHEGLLVVDMQHRVLEANPSYCRIMGASRETLIGRPAALLDAPTLQRSGYSTEAMFHTLQSEGSWRAKVQTERADGTPCILQVTVADVDSVDDSPRMRVLTLSDLSQQFEQERERDSDALTGLPNQEAFTRQLRLAMREGERDGFMLCVCMIDLDRFREINQRYGEAAGDTVLAQVAQRLRGALRAAPQWSDMIARLPGDEFALLLRAANIDEAQRAVERMQSALRGSYHLPPPHSQHDIDITASLGVTLYPTDTSDAETLLRHAGHALYRAKQHGGSNALRYFDTAKRARDEASLIHLARMQQALDRGELCLHYQPKIDMQAGTVLGMEALLRWQHPDQGLLMPGEFLPQIEQSGLALRIGDWIIDQALKRSAQWLAQGLKLEVSVNVTAQQLQASDFAQRLQELIQRHTEPVAQHLCLEVLESAALADIDASQALIQRCQAFGVRFALDDFGTGYSTLTYLKKLPVDSLKVDRSFVQNMLIDAQDMALVEGVIGLARHFDCSVVAEGIESAAHARALLRLGCHLGQGNGIAPAMPAFEVPAWVEAFTRTPWLKQPAEGPPSLAQVD